MKKAKTYRKHTAADIVAAAKANPQWTRGANLIATMDDGDIAFATIHPTECNGYSREIILLNCFSIRVPCCFGGGVVAMDIDDDALEALEALEGIMWESLT